MSTNVISTVATTDLFATWANAYNQVVWELNNDVLRTERTVTGNLTSNASLSTFGFVLNSITVDVSTNSTNTLENRNGILYFNDRQVETTTISYGYVSGGATGSLVPVVTTDRVTFSTSITAAHTPANLSQARFNLAGLSDSAIYGYALGGSSSLGVGAITADRITFSTSTTTAHTPANLSQARYGICGLSDRAVYGYAAGGTTGGSTATVDRITFSTSTTAAHTPANLPAIRQRAASISDGIIYGYIVGGQTGSSTTTTTAVRITFSTSTTAAYTPANLSIARYDLAGLSDGTVYGYAFGGSGIGIYVTTDRITFSTSTTAAHTPANLSQARTNLAGLSDDAVFGYAAGGLTAGVQVVTADRITFSTSTTAAHTPANLSQGRESPVGISNL